jgi:hypothetical protein
LIQTLPVLIKSRPDLVTAGRELGVMGSGAAHARAAREDLSSRTP